MAKILVVDDEDSLRRTLRRFLESEGHEVLEARDGVEAVPMLREHAVDLAVVDLMMPQMDGLRLLRRMQQDFPQLRAVVISAVEEIIDLAEREPNVLRTLKKPFTLDDLRDAWPERDEQKHGKD